MGAKYKKDDKCMPDNYVGVFHARAAKGAPIRTSQTQGDAVYRGGSFFGVDAGSAFALWGKP